TRPVTMTSEGVRTRTMPTFWSCCLPRPASSPSPTKCRAANTGYQKQPKTQHQLGIFGTVGIGERRAEKWSSQSGGQQLAEVGANQSGEHAGQSSSETSRRVGKGPSTGKEYLLSGEPRQLRM